MELLLITEDENKQYVLIKDFYKFMYNQTKHEHRKDFCTYCLQCFSSFDNSGVLAREARLRSTMGKVRFFLYFNLPFPKIW